MFLHGNFCSAAHLAGATTVPSHQRHGCLVSGAVFGGLQRNELEHHLKGVFFSSLVVCP